MRDPFHGGIATRVLGGVVVLLLLLAPTPGLGQNVGPGSIPHALTLGPGVPTTDLPSNLAGMNDIEPAATPAPSQIDAQATELEKEGVTWVRTEMVEQNGQINFSTYDYWILKSAPDHHLKVLALLDYATIPDFITHVNDALQPPGNFNPYITDFCNEASVIAQHYGTNLTAYEIYNEENSNYWIWKASNGTMTQVWPEQYGKMMTQAYMNIHAAEPGAVVLIGGLLPPSSDPTSSDPANNNSVGDYLNLTYGSSAFAWYRSNYGGADPVDAVGIHPYVSPAQMAPLFDHVRYTVDAWQPSAPFWATEFGWQASSSAPGGWNSPEELNQAANLTTAYQFFASRSDVSTALWFNWADFPGGNYGLGDEAANGSLSAIKNAWMSYYYLFHHDNANVGPVSLPSTVTAGSTFSVNVSVQNMGTSTWSEEGLWRGLPGAIRLGALGNNTFLFTSETCGGYANSAIDERAFTCGEVPPGALSYYDFTTTAPASPGTYPLTIGMVHDGMWWFGSGSTVNVVVTTAPPILTVASFSATPATMTLGNSTTLSVNVTGGTPPYAYTFGNLPPGCSTANVPSIACTPLVSGSYAPNITVRDSGGQTASASSSLTVLPGAGNVTVSAFHANPATIVLGNATTLVVAAQGGSAPYSYSYASLPPGCTSTDVANLSCVPTAAGVYDIGVTVTPAQGAAASASTPLKVLNGGPLSIAGFSAAPNPVAVGGTATLSVTPSGGIPPYSFSYSGLPPGCASANTSTLQCTPSASGNFTIQVTLADSGGSPKVATYLTLGVAPSSSTPLRITSFSASPMSVGLGNSTTLSVIFIGGTPPYTVSYLGLPSNCTSGNQSVMYCTPRVAGSFSITVDITDRDGTLASSTTPLTVTSLPGHPTLSSFTASRDPVPSGTATVLTANVTGGTTPYSYAYEGLPGGCASVDSPTLTCTPSVVGQFTVYVTATDTNREQVMGSLTLDVLSSSPQPLKVESFTAFPDPLVAGESTTLVTAVTGGASPYAYSYAGLPPGCTTSDSANLSCTPSGPGNYTVTVTVTDPSGHSATSSLDLKVAGSSGGNRSPGPLGLPTVYWALLATLLAMALALAALTVIRRKRRDLRT